MTRYILRYPGDPPARVQRMTGAEFVAQAGPRGVRVASEDPETGEWITTLDLPVEDVICDSCNDAIDPEAVCWLGLDRLWCDDCATRYWKAYLTPEGGAGP